MTLLALRIRKQITDFHTFIRVILRYMRNDLNPRHWTVQTVLCNQNAFLSGDLGTKGVRKKADGE